MNRINHQQSSLSPSRSVGIRVVDAADEEVARNHVAKIREQVGLPAAVLQEPALGDQIVEQRLVLR